MIKHEVHIYTDDMERVILECWICHWQHRMADSGKSPTVEECYRIACAHENTNH